MHSKNLSVYNRFVDMVNSNLAPPKTFEERIERQKLLKRCESYKHLRSSQKTMSCNNLHQKTKQPTIAENYKAAIRESMDILDNCRKQHNQNKQMRSSLYAFSGFCKTLDRHLLHQKKQLIQSELP